MIGQLIFLSIVIVAVVFFSKNVRKIGRNIKLGRSIDRSDHFSDRLAVLLKVAFGQTKMVKRPVAAILHLFVYVGFVVINLEVLEIVIDGLFGTHRIFFEPLGRFYGFLIGVFEVLALLVLVGVILFYARRNWIRLRRLKKYSMSSKQAINHDFQNFQIDNNKTNIDKQVQNCSHRPFDHFSLPKSYF
jgi:hypothetical protein